MVRKCFYSTLLLSVVLMSCGSGSDKNKQDDFKETIMYVLFDQEHQYSDVAGLSPGNVATNEWCKEVYNFSKNQIIMDDDDDNPVVEIIDGEIFVTPNPEQSAVMDAGFGQCPEEHLGEGDFRCHVANFFKKTYDIVFLRAEPEFYESEEAACEEGLDGSIEPVKLGNYGF